MDTEENQETLEARVERLELEIRQLQRLVGRGRSSPRREPVPGRDPPVRETVRSERARPGPPLDFQASDAWSRLTANSETWLARAGIGFVVLAFALLLKLSLDRGWITPPIRVAAALGAGTGLVFTGLRLEAERRRLAQILMGGGVALLYLGSYGGAVLWGLYPVGVAFALMSTTTVLAFVLAERQDVATLGLIGLLGGLATPFLLGGEADRAWIGALYCALVLAGGGGQFLLRGWKIILVAIVLAGGLVVSAISGVGPDRLPLVPWAVLTGVYCAVAVVGAVLRPVLAQTPSSRGSLIAFRVAAGVAVLFVVGSVATYFDLGLLGAGWVLLGMVLGLTAGVVLAPHAVQARGVAADVASLGALLAVCMILQDSRAVVLLGIAAVVYPLVSNRPGLGGLARSGHVAAIVGAGLTLILAAGATGGSMTYARDGALARLAFWILLGLVALRPGPAREFYGAAAWAGLMSWSLLELTAVDGYGQALVSLAWGLQGAVGLVVAHSRRHLFLQRAGLITLAILAGKLLLVDLDQLDAVLRILIFMGFGVLLVGLGWLVNRPPSTAPRAAGETRG